MTLYLLKYNNYFNRIIKKRDTINEYSEFILDSFTGVNFNPNDGIDTEHIVNYNGEETPDYCIITDESNNIVSRWYVIETVRTRALQYRVILFRDCVADWYDEVVNAPMFVEKATLNLGNPLIFNKENMTYNQVLKNQYLIKDPTGCPWIVGYIPKNFPESSTTVKAQYTNAALSANYVTPSLNTFLSTNFGVSYDATTGQSAAINPYPGRYTDIGIRWVYSGDRVVTSYVSVYNGYVYDIESEGTGSAAIVCSYDKWADPPLYSLFNPFIANLKDETILKTIRDVASSLAKTLSESQTKTFNSFNGQTVFDVSSNTTYQMTVVQEEAFPISFKVAVGSTTYQAINSGLSYNTGEYPFYGTPDSNSFKIKYAEPQWRLKFEPLATDIEVTVDQTRFRCTDSPYDIFCIPYGEITVMSGSETKIAKTNKEAAMAIANSFSALTGLSTSQFDIQLLPYCPATYVYAGKGLASGVIDIGSASVDYIKNPDDENISLLLWARSSSFQFNVSITYAPPANAIEQKIRSECDVYRLCSPNYNGVFEFSPEMNGGWNNIQIGCTYKPYNPFIHIRPNFGNLYGINPDKDSRGLICGGDWSLPQTTNAWAQYELNNKNYQAIFDRQIQNMEVQHQYQSTMEAINVATGTLGGATGGAMAGSAAGPWGAAAGALVGGTASLAGGIADMNINWALRREQKDYAKDLYGYQLGNIKALPNSLAKTSALVYNNKLFPFLEIYTATPIEKEALRMKIKYNGMTVGVVGTISQYQQSEPTYIKGQLIRMEGIAEDFHTVNTIAQELNKGVFI